MSVAHRFAIANVPALLDSHNAHAKVLKEERDRLKQMYSVEAHQRLAEAKNVMNTLIKSSRKENAGLPCAASLANSKGRCSVAQKEKHPRALLGNEELQTVNKLGANGDEQIIIFVSFSMPEASLKQLNEALKMHPEAKLVLRGLIDDSMDKTARYIQSIEGVFEVNPELFETFSIEAVPTFMLMRKGKAVAKLSGNITLPFAKELFNAKVKQDA